MNWNPNNRQVNSNTWNADNRNDNFGLRGAVTEKKAIKYPEQSGYFRLKTFKPTAGHPPDILEIGLGLKYLGLVSQFQLQIQPELQGGDFLLSQSLYQVAAFHGFGSILGSYQLLHQFENTVLQALAERIAMDLGKFGIEVDNLLIKFIN